ncbi:MAG: hypothetical protein FWE37_07655 [Spirochaetaceae bacterium]|nr:hypothetical protein [Spirochaetaceae bacterium]
MSHALLLIDCQNDFIDDPIKAGSLAVPGSYGDMQRLAAFISRQGDKLAAIYASMDMHSPYSIFFPSFWLDKDNNQPNPFTVITLNNLTTGQFKPADPKLNTWVQYYLTKLQEVGRPLILWPPHCLAGAAGSNIHPLLKAAIDEWAINRQQEINSIFKGQNILSEFYSIFKAEVAINTDSSTLVNQPLLDKLCRYDKVYIAGEALSHCVRATIEDIIAYAPPEKLPHFTLISNCSSPVAGFEDESLNFIKKLAGYGLNCLDSSQISLS